MPDSDVIKILSEDSQSVQSHLGIMQGVIERMATNSASCKSWCITLVSAILVVVADKGKPEYALIAMIPVILFMALDTYYLAMERSFRATYNIFVKKLHEGSLAASDLYSVRLQGSMSKHQIDSLKSFSIWGFYITLGLMVMLTKFFIL